VRLLIFILRSVFLVLVLANVASFTFAQDRCGTVEYTKKLHGENHQQNKLQFEDWIARKLQSKKRADAERQQAVYEIPVVVHVIHNGEAIGDGSNISEAQILSQISVLNKDFKRLNSDASQTTPEFLPVAGSLDIEFVLAKQDPEGLATTGIVRVEGTKSTWSINDNYELKALSYWPAEDYLNIWVCNLTGVLGYAQFPVSDLPGLENSSDNRLTDGLVISYDVFGSTDDGPFDLMSRYNKGRTTTHEMGHFFGLRHIWGDDEGSCNGTDYINDTPNQSNESSGCPTQPRITCEVTAMYQNYLDYTDDACMNLFTMEQVGRMATVLENSPRRASLLTSQGSQSPLPLPNDLGIREITDPLSGECATSLAPSLVVRNYGSNNVTSARVRLTVDGVPVETKDFNLSPALSLLQSATLNFSTTSFTRGSHTVSFEILLTNGVPDGSAYNNTLSQPFLIPETTTLPITENFTVFPSAWRIINPDLQTTWQLAPAPSDEPGNTAMKMDFFNYEDNVGDIDFLLTPVFDLTNAPVALLLFDVAYARFQNDNDGLQVVVLSDCNTDITQGTVVYDKSGAALQTRSPTQQEFIPSNEAQWRTEFIDLSSFAGQSNLQLAFVGINDWGNNLYLDDINVVTTPLEDVTLQEIISPSPVSCASQVNPKILIKNAGTLITSVKVRVTINGQDAMTQTFEGLNLLGGSTIELELSSVNLQRGDNTVFVELLEPNGLPDMNPADNSLTIYSVINGTPRGIPLRQSFEKTFEPEWTAANPSGGMAWEIKGIGTNQTLYVNGYGNTVIGDRSWFVSPVLDFSAATEASLAFDFSYAYRGNDTGQRRDELLILASRDCGISYTDTLFREVKIALANNVLSSQPWEPDTTGWQKDKTIVLNEYVGEQDVRIAFVFVNANGNNIYLDNIEFFVSENPSYSIGAFPMLVYPNPYILSFYDDEPALSVVFNLQEASPVSIELVDLMGKVLFSSTQENTLNQTYTISTLDMSSGTYIVKAKTNTGIFTQKVIVLK
jgi:hypothetical protein